MSLLIPSLLAAGREARTYSDRYRLLMRIHLECTPREIVYLMESGAWDHETRGHIAKLLDNLTLGVDEIRPYEAERFGDHVTLLKGPQPNASLIFVLGGRGGLPFMPISLLVQYFDARKFDVLVVRDPLKQAFLGGIFAHSTSFRGMIERLAREQLGRYSDVRTLGTSAGGAGALAAAAVLDLPVAAAFCGNRPSKHPDHGKHPQVQDVEAMLHQAAEKTGTRFSCVYGAQSEYDVRYSRDLATLVPAELFPIDGVSDHNVLHQLHLRRELADVLARVGLA